MQVGITGETVHGGQSLTTVEWAQFFGYWVPHTKAVAQLPYLDQPEHALPANFTTIAQARRAMLAGPVPVHPAGALPQAPPAEAAPLPPPPPPPPGAIDDLEPMDIAGFPGAADGLEDLVAPDDIWEGLEDEGDHQPEEPEVRAFPRQLHGCFVNHAGSFPLMVQGP